MAMENHAPIATNMKDTSMIEKTRITQSNVPKNKNGLSIVFTQLISMQMLRKICLRSHHIVMAVAIVNHRTLQ